MNKSRLIWGIICLAIAGLLTVLNFTLSEDSLMFMIGDQNMPWIPPVVLGVVGIVLLAGAGRPESPPEPKAKVVVDEDKAALNKRLENIAWGCFFILLGGFLFMRDSLQGGLWSIAVGLVLLGLNAARYFYGLRMSGFTTFLGLLAVLGGVGELVFQRDLDGALLLIILGAYLLLKPYFDRRQLFGKAEQS